MLGVGSTGGRLAVPSKKLLCVSCSCDRYPRSHAPCSARAAANTAHTASGGAAQGLLLLLRRGGGGGGGGGGGRCREERERGARDTVTLCPVTLLVWRPTSKIRNWNVVLFTQCEVVRGRRDEGRECVQ
jgi:hypothetical protein